MRRGITIHVTLAARFAQFWYLKEGRTEGHQGRREIHQGRKEGRKEERKKGSKEARKKGKGGKTEQKEGRKKGTKEGRKELTGKMVKPIFCATSAALYRERERGGGGGVKVCSRLGKGRREG